MRISRAEILVLIYVGGLAVAGVATWISASAFAGLVAGGGADVAGAGWAVLVSRAVSAVMALAVLFGLLWLYPAMRRDAHERGRLVTQSRSFMQAALTDVLTGLRNRRYFDDALAEYMKEFGLIDRPLGVMILDLDHFKAINDTYGHDNGDLVLRQVSLTLQQHTRYHDVLARIGGEEFAVLFPNTDEFALKRLAERIREAIATAPVTLDAVPVAITASVGIAVWDGREGGGALIKRADQYLYRAKTTGRNRVIGRQGVAIAEPVSPDRLAETG
ncbi:MAG: GGDEF domain-containing protein [Roseitalea porphyridii]|jgi:two-component system cell cycle response regulator|uniref:GGDEF domain-containing protein n=1 Tax=Roseitalea porphyridii TaxID=1852022 RepID=UPI0032EEDEE4